VPIIATDLLEYGAASRPDDDADATGGAIDLTARPLDSEWSTSARPEIVSTDADDTLNVTIVGRLPNGTIDSETKALNGTTPVLFDTTFERLLRVTKAGGSEGVVSVRQGASGSTRHSFGLTELVAFRHFVGALADAEDPVVRYEKAFKRNNHSTLALQTAVIALDDDPDDLYRIGVCVAKDDSTSIANRLAAPAGVSFVDDAVEVAVPTNTLDAGEAIGFWREQTLAAEQAAGKGRATVSISGVTA
jgi:hypothetical protein